MNGDRLKIAVFIDFDNIEIGVKSTLNRHFDIGTVLEAIKERGEVVTKVAYGDWKRAGDHSRSMTQHAIQMVQRNLTPGGDKNGADINLALDALEMAFTRSHINAFVIVGGDSDFIALVEKLKQYDKKVLVVGGRSFTSGILQRNCHEFIAYENLIAPQVVTRRPTERASTRVTAGATDTNLAKALPLVRRALKVLVDREVSPQLGLLKSTLLQLDSTFSERDYNASTFRDFIEKMAAAGYVNLKQVDRSLLVEMKDGDSLPAEEPEREAAPAEVSAPVAAASQPSPASSQQPVPGPSPEQMEEGLRDLTEAFRGATVNPHWPMYLRNVKQYVKNAAPTYDERRFGFVTFLELVRAAQRSGLFRLERNRQGILRVFPGPQFPQQTLITRSSTEGEAPVDASQTVDETADEQVPVLAAELITEAAPIPEATTQPVGDIEESEEDRAFNREQKPAAPVRPRRAPVTRKKASTPPRPRAAAAPRRPRKKTPESE